MKPPQIVAAWQRGDIDAAYVWPPALYGTPEERQGHLRSEGSARRACRPSDGLVADKNGPSKTPNSWPPSPRVLRHAYAITSERQRLEG